MISEGGAESWTGTEADADVDVDLLIRMDKSRDDRASTEYRDVSSAASPSKIQSTSTPFVVHTDSEFPTGLFELGTVLNCERRRRSWSVSADFRLPIPHGPSTSDTIDRGLGLIVSQ